MTLREARQQRKLTQEELAARSGVEQTTISNLETGRVQSPTWETVSRLCKVLRVKPEDVFPVPSGKEVA
jgi:transcriptional regulator with XRE-family HTH domain